MRIAISRKRHFRSPKRKNENTLQYKVPPKTWENSPQKPILAIRKWFFGHCYVQKYFFLTRIPTKYLNSYIFWTGSSRRFRKGRTLVWASQLHLGCLRHHCGRWRMSSLQTLLFRPYILGDCAKGNQVRKCSGHQPDGFTGFCCVLSWESQPPTSV